jgi:hypothetical protein
MGSLWEWKYCIHSFNKKLLECLLCVRHYASQSLGDTEVLCSAKIIVGISKCSTTVSYNNDDDGQRPFHFKCALDTLQHISAYDSAVLAWQHSYQSEHWTNLISSFTKWRGSPEKVLYLMLWSHSSQTWLFSKMIREIHIYDIGIHMIYMWPAVATSYICIHIYIDYIICM